jgi:hypothetical protein
VGSVAPATVVISPPFRIRNGAEAETLTGPARRRSPLESTQVSERVSKIYDPPLYERLPEYETCCASRPDEARIRTAKPHHARRRTELIRPG